MQNHSTPCFLIEESQKSAVTGILQQYLLVLSLEEGRSQNTLYLLKLFQSG